MVCWTMYSQDTATTEPLTSLFTRTMILVDLMLKSPTKSDDKKEETFGSLLFLLQKPPAVWVLKKHFVIDNTYYWSQWNTEATKSIRHTSYWGFLGIWFCHTPHPIRHRGDSQIARMECIEFQDIVEIIDCITCMQQHFMLCKERGLSGQFVNRLYNLTCPFKIKKESQWLSAELYSAKQIKFVDSLTDSLRPCNFRLYIWNYMAFAA